MESGTLKSLSFSMNQSHNIQIHPDMFKGTIKGDRSLPLVPLKITKFQLPGHYLNSVGYSDLNHSCQPPFRA